jgi:two-component system, chemotaxis family, CheB/CheR fusion protein
MRSRNDFYVVGIGSSAGGFEALKLFFENLPQEPGAAFVVIQHLSPKHESSTHKILAQHTNMPVEKVLETTKIQPNRVYVLPENKELKIEDGSLSLEDRDPNKVINYAIDNFFMQLADAYREKAIGVVLSGTGSDGARGVQIIKEKGGMVMVQSPESASFDSMPNVAISSDHPDYISSPDRLATDLIGFMQNPEILDKDKLSGETSRLRDSLQEIIHHVSSYSGVSFKNYKPGTIIRRIEKRIKINHLTKLQEYEHFLKANPKEVQQLYGNLLIGVTRFFRDSEAYHSLEAHVIPQLFKDKKSFDLIRVWVPACSSGEEAYSLAILLDEYRSRQNSTIEFKIFATDIDQRSIDIASAGRYAASISEDMSPERLKRYFNKIGDYYEINKEIRGQIIFSKHNLLSDPPFIRLDLISCRNLFIYFLDETQNKVLHNFNYSLKPDGFLFLGVNESINEQEKFFEPIDLKNKIFKNKPSGNVRSLRSINHFFNDYQQNQLHPQHIRQRLTSAPVHEPFADLLAERFAPPCLLINQQEDVVYSTDRMQNYLQFSNNRTDLNVYSMLRGNLILIFRNGLRQLEQGERSILFKDCQVEKGDATETLDISFSTIANTRSGSQDRLFLVEFREKTVEEPGAEKNVQVLTPDSYSKSEIENLERELKLARRELRFTSDELETINEELQSSNEEMQSANEELQSTNEELQSSNEELQTVNVELKNKIDTITVLHDDVNNLFNSTQIATIFLDSSLNIRIFTPPAKHYFNIRETDIGRPISHYSYNFSYHHLLDDVQQVMEKLAPIEREIEHKEGSYSIMRLLPYKTESQQIKGVVITLTDITEIKRSNQELQKLSEELLESERHLMSLLDHTPDFIARFDRNLRYTFVNKAIEEASGLSYKDFIGKHRIGLSFLHESAQAHESMKEVLESGEVQDFYFTQPLVTGERFYYTKLVPEFAQGSREVQSILSVSTDITALKSAEKKLLHNHQQLSEMYDRMDNFVHVVAHDLRTPLVNLKLLAELFEKSQQEEERLEFSRLIGSSVSKLDNTLKGLIKIIEISQANEIHTKEVAFSDALYLALQDFDEQIKAHDIRVEHDFADCPSITYSEAYLESILKNLLSNSIKYRKPDQQPLIQLKTSRKDQFVLLTITDNGTGFDAQALKGKLFKPFKRFHQQTSGMGIGLYIIKYMVVKNGGKIEVESEINKGSTFKLYLKPYSVKKQHEKTQAAPDR